jgi:hypothetical protein
MEFDSAVADAEPPPAGLEVELVVPDELALDEHAAIRSSADAPSVAATVRKARRLLPKYTDTVTPLSIATKFEV